MVKQEKLIKSTTYLIILYIVFMGCATDTTTSPKKLTLVDATIEVLSEDPENPECWLEYGRASLLSKNPLAAEYAFKRAIDLDKHYLPAYKHLGLILVSQRKFDEAKRYYELGLKLWNKDSELWTAYGYCLHDLGREEDALVAFRKAVENSSDLPSVVSARLGASALLRRMGRKDAAEHEYQEAAKIYPQLGQILEKQKRLHDDYVGPRADYFHYLQAVEYGAKGKFIEARKELEKTLSLYKTFRYKVPERVKKIINDMNDQKISRDVAIYLFKGLSYYEKGALSKSLIEYNKAITVDPNYATSYNLRGGSYSIEKYDRAIADFSKAIEIDPKDEVAYYNRGVAHHSRAQWDQAISDFNKAIGFNPKMEMAYVNRGVGYLNKGFYDQAIADFGKAIETNPQMLEAYINRGNVYLVKGRFDHAISNYNKAIELGSGNDMPHIIRGNNIAVAFDNRAVAYLKLGDKKKACSDWKMACKLGSCANYRLAIENNVCK